MESLRIKCDSWSEAEEGLHLNWGWSSSTEQIQNLFYLAWLKMKAGINFSLMKPAYVTQVKSSTT